MRNASCAARSYRPGTLLVLAVLTLGGLTLASSPAPRPWAAPTIGSTVPADGALQVNISAPVVVRFTEPMNETTVNGNVSISPPVALNYTWVTTQLLELRGLPALANCTAYAVSIGGKDRNGTDLVLGPVPNPWRFMTACDRPFVVSTSPADGAQSVGPNQDIVVTFSERMDLLTISIAFVPVLSGNWSGDLDVPTGTVFTLRLTGGTSFQTNTTYTATVTGQSNDTHDNLVPSLVPNPWAFHVNEPPWASKPGLSLTGCLDAGTDLTITWTMSDLEDPPAALAVTLSFLNGFAWDRIDGPRAGYPASAAYVWTLPALDVEPRVRINVTDTAGASASNESDSFRIDTGPPRVGSTTPPDGATDVAAGATITVSFTEEMNRPTAESAFSATPPFPAPRFNWPGNQTLAVDTGGLLDNTTYTVTVAGSARDTCGPGRAMGTPYTFSFTTALPQPSAPINLTVVSFDDSSVTLAWAPVTTFLSGEVIPPGTAVVYVVYRSNNESGPENRVSDTTSTTLTDRNLAPSTRYVYRVRALVGGVYSSPSATTSVTTRVPFLTTSEGRLSLLVTFAAIAAAFVVGLRMRRQRRKAEAEAALEAEIREIVEQVRRVRAEPDPQARRAAEDALQSHFRSVVEGDEGDEGPPDPRLDGLYRALAQALVRSPEVDVAHGRKIVDGKLGPLAAGLRSQGAAYRLLSEAEASVDSALFPGLPASARKALLLVYFYALEEYLSRRLRALIPPGSTLLLGERGHINVRRRGWEAQWAGLTLGNLLYLMDHNTHVFVADVPRWEKDVEPILREAVEARNRTAHPSREGPPLDRVRDLVYRAMPAVESILTKGTKGVAA